MIATDVRTDAPSKERWPGLGEHDRIVAVVALLLIVAFAPPLVFESWTPRFAILLAVTPLGVASLTVSARRGDRPAQLAAAAVAVAVVSALFSGALRSTLVGFAGRDLSTLTVAGSLGLWSLARALNPQGRDLLTRIFIWSTTAGAAIGVLQVVLAIDTGSLALLNGRPSSWWINPVYMGAMSAGGLLCAVAAAAAERTRALQAAIVLLGAAVALSGSRIAVLSALALLAAHAAVHRRRDVLAVVGLALVGLCSGLMLGALRDTVGSGTERLTGATTGGRLEVWGYGLRAFLDRPLVGHGFGRFRPAVQGEFSDDFVREYAPDELLQAWFDAHNIAIGLLVAVGAIGVVLIAWWTASWLRRVEGPLVWAAAAIAATWLAQPISLVTLPIALLLFGAARPSRAIGRDDDVAAAPVGPPWSHLLLTIGLVLSATVIVADLGLKRAADQADGDLAAAVAVAYWSDPVVADVVAQTYLFQNDDTGVGLIDSVEWRRRAVEAEPDRPYWWASLGYAQLATGDLDGAAASFERALELQPNSLRTLRGLGGVAIEREDLEELRRLIARFCDLGQPECEADADEVLENARDR